SVKSAPVFGNKLLSVNNSDAVMQRRGIVRVVELEDAVAVVADNYWRAKQALAALEVRFETSANDQVSTQTIHAQYDRDLVNGELHEDVEEGDSNTALANAAEIIEATYRVPYLA